MKYIREFTVNSDMLASNLGEEGGACVVSYQDIFSNKFQVLLGRNNCIECNIDYTILDWTLATITDRRYYI